MKKIKYFLINLFLVSTASLWLTPVVLTRIIISKNERDQFVKGNLFFED